MHDDTFLLFLIVTILSSVVEGVCLLVVKMCSQGFLLLAVSTLLLVSSGHCDAESEASGGTRSKVIELTEANYDEVIKNTPLILVEFYAPWYVVPPEGGLCNITLQ